MRFKFELVTAGSHLGCVVPNWNSLTFRMYQVGSVRVLLFMFLALR